MLTWHWTILAAVALVAVGALYVHLESAPTPAPVSRRSTATPREQAVHSSMILRMLFCLTDGSRLATRYRL